jgi:hypothetical protein
MSAPSVVLLNPFEHSSLGKGFGLAVSRL